MNSTNTEAGLRLGYELAQRNYRDGVINRVVLASDGVANVGNTDPNVLAQYAQDYYGRNIFLSTVGVGRGNYNDQLLEQLADKGNGAYSFLDSTEAAERIFAQDLTGTLQTIAKDAKVQVDFNPNVVRRYRLIGYENRAVADQDFRNNAVDAGEVGAGPQRHRPVRSGTQSRSQRRCAHRPHPLRRPGHPCRDANSAKPSRPAISRATSIAPRRASS